MREVEAIVVVFAVALISMHFFVAWRRSIALQSSINSGEIMFDGKAIDLSAVDCIKRQKEIIKIWIEYQQFISEVPYLFRLKQKP